MSHASSPIADARMLAPTGPWWRHPMMWLVVGGPSVVVVASIVTLVLAARHADPVVNHSADAGSAHASAEDPDTSGKRHTVTATANDAGLQPAMKARNHAATGGQEK